MSVKGRTRMARKSRKESGVQTRESFSKTIGYQVGFYLRLSDKEAKDRDSESIENQFALLKDFIKNKPDFRLISTFTDDGKTGTNFKRSGFEQMMDEVRSGRINCIIVKDLSRFGRNYLEAGHYIEHVFPFLNVRFIAVTDGFDTLTATPAQLSYLIPLKNIMNENYARDISKKERSAKKVLRKKGCFLGAYAMYGYEKTSDKHVIGVDPEAAVHVKTIFDLCEKGYSDSAIAKYLNERKVLCPARYKYEKGIVKNAKYANTSGWYPQTIAGILTSRVYIGDMVQGARRSKEIKGKKEVVPKSEWDIVSGTHEAIISKEQFDRVQEIRMDRHRQYEKMIQENRRLAGKSENSGILKGKVFCGDCKRAMVRKHIKSCKDKYRYVCDMHEKTGQCSRKFLPEQELFEMLGCLIRRQIEAACQVKEWLHSREQEEARELFRFEQTLRETEDKRNRLVQKMAALYQDWKEGILDQDEYLYMKKRYEEELTGCEGEREELMGRKQEYILAYTSENPALKAVSELPDDFLLSRELVDRLIERIEIYEGNRVRVSFKFQDEMQRLLRAKGGGVINEERGETAG
ncbi:hypothetical protein D7X87_19505 [bacterium D16-54]|jgi:hypothetical protein|nr:hypothetical protein D7X87_19505 [bacterium D16-54]RKJ12077.1 hypothetical protein D7X65_19945 [bacterium D16-56]